MCVYVCTCVYVWVRGNGVCVCVYLCAIKEKYKLLEKRSKQNHTKNKQIPNLSFFRNFPFNFGFRDGHSRGHQTEVCKSFLHDLQNEK